MAECSVPPWTGQARFEQALATLVGSCLEPASRYTEPVKGSAVHTPLYFFPDQDLTESQLRSILVGEDRTRRAWAISHHLRYAQWDDIWTYVTRDEVREIFGELDLPDTLRAAWGRMLKVEAPVG